MMGKSLEKLNDIIFLGSDGSSSIQDEDIDNPDTSETTAINTTASQDSQLILPTLSSSGVNLINSSGVDTSPQNISTMNSPLDLLKNPFFMGTSPLLALNPQLYAAQLANLQAAQLMLAKQSASADDNIAETSDRKRSADVESPLDLGPRAKYPRTGSSPPLGKEREGVGADSPLDLSGPTKLPGADLLGFPGGLGDNLPPGLNPFLMNPGMLSLFSQFQMPALLAASGGGGGNQSDLAANLLSLAAQKSQQQNVLPPKSSPSSRSGPSPWAEQWLLKSSLEAAAAANRPSHGGPSHGGPSSISDVFKCVFCKESYQSLEELTKHMKEAKHPTFPGAPPGMYPLISSIAPTSQQMTSPIRASPSSSSTASSPMSSMSARARDVLKDQVPMPRKLVRGQDVWIGRADEQTRDILKCMGCGASFRSLDLLTKHMSETQHYKKVISNDQLSSWKYSGDSGAGASGAGMSGSSPGNKNHINSVLSCKVCQKGFSSLKELSDHMVRADHYAPPTDSFGHATGAHPGLLRPTGPPTSSPHLLNTQSAKDRKKALPVKKLLELERARHEVMGGALGSRGAAASSRDIMETGKLPCERCQEKIPLEMFISHVQHCIGKPTGSSAPQIKLEDRAMDGEDKKNKDSSSILGSLEMMVKGNFMSGGGSSTKTYISQSSSPSSSPATIASSLSCHSPVTVTANRFSMASILPQPLPPVSTVSSESGVAPPPGSPPGRGSCSSKPGSPSSSVSRSSPLHILEQQLPANGGKDFMESKNQMDGVAASPLSFSNRSPSAYSNRSPTLSSRSNRSPTPAGSEDGERSSVISPILLAGIKKEIESNKPLTGENQPTKVSSKNSNPLMALQALCDTQSKPKNPPRSTSNSRPAISDPASMMEFSWAVNQAVTTAASGGTNVVSGGDATNIKCPFCDTLFVSKGAYRHHLSKMHFNQSLQGAANSTTPPPPARGGASPPVDSSLQSKYAKYSQLAKQLSCNQK